MPSYYNYPYQGFAQPQQVMPMQRPQTYVDNNYPVIKGRPVSSFEEARASMIDFDGSVFYFPDLANQKIYTKQINLDGTPSIKIYELAAPPQPPVQPNGPIPDNLVTKAEFEQTVNNLLNQIEALKNSAQIQIQPQPQMIVQPIAQQPQSQPQLQPQATQQTVPTTGNDNKETFKF